MKIHIQYNKFLDPIFIAYVKSHEKWATIPVPEISIVKNKVKQFKEIWDIWGDTIVREMQNIMGVTFDREVIDVHIVSLNPRSYSNPIVFKSGWTPEEFVDHLAHELTHAIWTGNYSKYTKTFAYVKDKFPNENEGVINHIITYSVLDEIYRRISKNFTTEISTQFSDRNMEYIRAHEIADSDGQFVLDILDWEEATV